MRRPTMLLIALALTCFVAPGCVRRTITITSNPPGALLWLNGREIGRTPVDVDFLYYGVYDVQLVADGYEPLLTKGEANPPWWDNIPIDLAAELAPGEQHARIAWHFELQPRDDDAQALILRAQLLRQELPATSPAATQPQPSNSPASETLSAEPVPAQSP